MYVRRLLALVVLTSKTLFRVRKSLFFPAATQVHHKKTAPHVFDSSYEVKSCLSPDLEQHERSTCRFYAMVIDAGGKKHKRH